MEAYVYGVSTCKFDGLVAALGVGAGTSKSDVSHICAQLDDGMNEFRKRPLSHLGPHFLYSVTNCVRARVVSRVDARNSGLPLVTSRTPPTIRSRENGT